MYTVRHVDKYKITFKLVFDHWPRARYRAAVRLLRNTALDRVAIWTGSSSDFANKKLHTYFQVDKTIL
jgi:hypothetical protein